MINRHVELAKSAAIFAAVLLACDVTAAALARYFELLPGPEYFAEAERQFRTDDPVFHHGLRPNVSATSYWGGHVFRVFTNSLGFKDKSVRNIPLSSNRTRVLIIGDSFTEGVGIPFEKTFVGLIDERLSPQKIEVLNAGVASYAASIYLSKINHLVVQMGLDVDHVVVFLDVSDIRDDAVFYRITDDFRVRDSLDSPPGGEAYFLRQVDPYADLKQMIKQHSLIARSVDSLLDAFKADSWAETSEDDLWYQATINQHASRWTFDDEAWETYGRAGREAASSALSELVRILDANAIGMTMVVYPWPAQIAEPSGNHRHVEYWRRFAEDHGAGFVDLFPAFLTGEPPRDILDKYFIFNDVHWNQSGHRLVAEQFLRKFHPPDGPKMQEPIVTSKPR